MLWCFGTKILKNSKGVELITLACKRLIFCFPIIFELQDDALEHLFPSTPYSACRVFQPPSSCVFCFILGSSFPFVLHKTISILGREPFRALLSSTSWQTRLATASVHLLFCSWTQTSPPSTAQLRTRSSYLYLAFFLQSPYKSRKFFGELMLEIRMKYVFTSRPFFGDVIMILSSLARAFFPYNIAMSDLDS